VTSQRLKVYCVQLWVVYLTEIFVGIIQVNAEAEDDENAVTTNVKWIGMDIYPINPEQAA
jgi:hypothetical protein